MLSARSLDVKFPALHLYTSRLSSSTWSWMEGARAVVGAPFPVGVRVVVVPGQDRGSSVHFGAGTVLTIIMVLHGLLSGVLFVIWGAFN